MYSEKFDAAAMLKDTITIFRTFIPEFKMLDAEKNSAMIEKCT